jgi:hypothetical protein
VGYRELSRRCPARSSAAKLARRARLLCGVSAAVTDNGSRQSGRRHDGRDTRRALKRTTAPRASASTVYWLAPAAFFSACCSLVG